MNQNDFEKMVSVKIITKSGHEVCSSAILERDPNNFSWNRMTLIGTRENMDSAMELHAGGLVRWELYVNQRWPHSDKMSKLSGSGAVHSIGMPSGLSIADDGIQKFAELKIYECVEEFNSTQPKSNSVTFIFLQRPLDWYVHRRAVRASEQQMETGEWIKLANFGVRFRLLTFKYHRRDERISKEKELLHLPAVEISKFGEQDAISPDLTEEVWFGLQILMRFRFRQLITTLAEFWSLPNGSRERWHDTQLQPIKEKHGYDAPPFHAKIEMFLTRGLKVILAAKQHKELLHSAAYNYANSFHSSSLESSLTSRIEAFESLVNVFEEVNCLKREIIEIKSWKKIVTSLKKSLDENKIDSAIIGSVKQSISNCPTLTLQQRLERMIKFYQKSGKLKYEDIYSGIKQMIKCRNDIVHGRVIKDVDRLYIESARAQAIFEKMFLCFLNCHNFPVDGYTRMTISSYERRMSAS